ncbi:MAG: hypothetical protein HFJ91_06885 [Muribaculaceae bacterium]|nr:hypothetical protein [Muribaculaceae bacterium]
MISNREKKYILNLTARMVVAAGLLMSACVDELPGNETGYITDGEVSIELQAAFSPFSEAILSRSETIPGKAMSDLSDLCLLAYTAEGKLIENDYFPMEIKFDQSDLDDEPRTDPDASNGDTAETSTKCLKKDLTLPAGRYYIIAVANLGKYTRDEKTGQITRLKSTFEALTQPGGEYYGQYATLDALRDMTVTWDLDNDANNRQMLGFFSTPGDEAPSYSSQFQMVDLSRNGISIRTWLRRCASKVTIDFDGSSLRENVRVYLKDARIYDIPKTCTLGFGYGEEDKSYNNAAGKDGIHTADEPRLVNSITYGEGTDHKKWPAITKGTPHGAYIEEDNVKEYDYSGLHSETADALFFYENMQGESLYDKFQTADLNNGGVQNSEIEKDGVPYGTYIEVTAHYYATANGAVSEGDIKYRFMLGKDTKRNCDAERNYHYKLTLKLRGNANDYDWHIDYKDTEGFDIPNPWYVSYLYNHDALLPFKFTPREGYRVDSITAKITENPWYPTEVPDGENKAPYTNTYNKKNGNGFLSMWETDDVVITPEDSGYERSEYINSADGSFKYGDVNLAGMNENYYLGNSKSTSDKNRSIRVYKFDGSTDNTNNGREAYSYRIENGKYTFNIPLFTRAKVLIKQTGYSGNNPFVGYERHAKLKVTAHCSKIGNPKETYTKDTETTVIQVRRIVNPKGVYRKSGNNQDFNVTLMRLPGDNEPDFVEFKSDGPWMAEIIGDKNFITLDGKQIVTGSTKTPIKFQIRFNKMNKEGDPVRNAVVRVRYHNYTCTHLIFVRQGYDAMELSKTAVQMVNNTAGTVTPTKWNTFNMIAKDKPATDPRDEGSMFKYGNETQPIDASCNVYTTDGKYLGTPKFTFPTPSEFNNPPAIKLVTSVDKDNKVTVGAGTWDGVTYDIQTGFTMDVATVRDFEQLYLTPNIQFGYGVLYADGATTTQASVSDAYGWYRGENDNTKGMRGMFVYYWDRNNPDDSYNARNLFFPIGRSGFGHRKHRGSKWAKDTPGTLRYSCNRNGYASTFESVAPLFCNLHHRPGAIYWVKKRENNYLDWSGALVSDVCAGLDINYFSFDVNGIESGNILPVDKQGNMNVIIGSDACFLRTVSR